MPLSHKPAFAGLTGKDTSLSIAAVLFVLFYVFVHTRSMFISFLSLIQIVTCIPIAYLPFRWVFGVQSRKIV